MITSMKFLTGSGCTTRLPLLVLSTYEKCFIFLMTQCLRLLRSKLAHPLVSVMEVAVAVAVAVAVTVGMNIVDLVREEADLAEVSVDAEGVHSVAVAVAVEVVEAWEVKLLLEGTNFK
mmetsp:Transcript_3050/g.3792  ORF Transcript_3050/g.3792 Transcript_3050/m.3792 type:complete len:118 (-) Transcript_3050:228-581(-)